MKQRNGISITGKDGKLPEWTEKTVPEKVLYCVFILSAVVAAYAVYHTVFIDYSLWLLEEAALGVLMLTDALFRWKYCGKKARAEMCIGILFMIILLMLMWL